MSVDRRKIEDVGQATEYAKSGRLQTDVDAVARWHDWPDELSTEVVNVLRHVREGALDKLDGTLADMRDKHDTKKFRERWSNVTMLLFSLLIFFAGAHLMNVHAAYVGTIVYELVDFYSVAALLTALVTAIYYAVLRSACRRRAEYWYAVNRLCDTVAAVKGALSMPPDDSKKEK